LRHELVEHLEQLRLADRTGDASGGLSVDEDDEGRQRQDLEATGEVDRVVQPDGGDIKTAGLVACDLHEDRGHGLARFAALPQKSISTGRSVATATSKSASARVGRPSIGSPSRWFDVQQQGPLAVLPVAVQPVKQLFERELAVQPTKRFRHDAQPN
jgi:hypothetical protein